MQWKHMWAARKYVWVSWALPKLFSGICTTIEVFTPRVIWEELLPIDKPEVEGNGDHNRAICACGLQYMNQRNTSNAVGRSHQSSFLLNRKTWVLSVLSAHHSLPGYHSLCGCHFLTGPHRHFSDDIVLLHLKAGRFCPGAERQKMNHVSLWSFLALLTAGTMTACVPAEQGLHVSVFAAHCVLAVCTFKVQS